MKRDLLPLLACPDCRGKLQLEEERSEGHEVLAGALLCPACGTRFPISSLGVPQLLPAALLEGQAEDEDTRRKQIEMKARDEQVEQYDKLPGLLLFGRIEIPMALSYCGVKQGDLMLEGGCGNGRMTQEFAKKCRRLVAMDFSLESLHMNYRRLQAAGVQNVDLVQADMSNLPFGDDLFNAIASCQVIEHLPSHEARVAAIRGFGRVSKPGAGVTVSGYKYNLFERLFGSKEGEHPGNIPYFRFTKGEFKALMEEALHVETINGSLVYCWVSKCRNAKKAPVGARRAVVEGPVRQSAPVSE